MANNHDPRHALLNPSPPQARLFLEAPEAEDGIPLRYYAYEEYARKYQVARAGKYYFACDYVSICLDHTLLLS